MSLKNKKILITCGPTGVPIDTMRIISNLSSGVLGQMMAKGFQKKGARVTLLEGPVTKPLRSDSIRILKFMFFDEFISLIRKELKKKYDLCIHAAAVSDFKIKRPRKTKLASRQKTFFLELVPTKKIINNIKRINPGLFLVGFKLESKITKPLALRKTRELFQKGKCDLVVANALSNGGYRGYVLDRKGRFLTYEKTRGQLAKSLIKIVDQRL